MASLLQSAAMSGAEGDWAALVGSRLCHDLVSPLGAIGNGLELMRMTHPGSPELDLLINATASAQARLRLFRLGFGAAPEGQMVDSGAVSQALAALAERIETRTALPPEAISRRQARRLVLAALCAENALAWGGTLHVGENAVRASAARLRLDDGLWRALSTGQPPEDPVPAVVQFALLAASGTVQVLASETTVTITL